MKLLSKFESLPRSKLINIAIFLSIITLLWSLAEGVISVFFGTENDSVSLIFFGIDSLVEVTSSCVVLWRFLKKDLHKGSPKDNLIAIERKATIVIGILFVILAIGTFSDAIFSLAKNKKPDSSLSGLIISSVTICFMIFLWLMKFSVAKQLNSSAMMSDAKCSLSCIQTAFVLFLGSLIYSVWNAGWWVDSTAALILGLFFAKEGIGMILWAMHEDFNGGCCKSDAVKNNNCDSSSNCCNDNNKECEITIAPEQIADKDNIKEES
ncbi:15321_t:CDS:1 [Racocetra persica]|uniref:15321_t:CDS:1 n=1 Tax=Racocetra persica TaxID=160502 RepID=A0ACA9PNK5_9GLOM|nr:15321_t:CDS:1 [Racocetra persica]